MSLPVLLLFVFFISVLVTGLWLSLARSQSWFDHPNQRSSHVLPTPKSGGAGFVVAFSLFVLILYFSQQLTWQHLLLAVTALVLAVMGFLDDLRNLGIAVRIGMHVLAAILALWLQGQMPILLFPWGALSTAWVVGPLLVLSLVWLINLYNFMDGIDGLAAMEAIFFCLAIAWFSSGAQFSPVTGLSLGLAVAVCGFLYFNLPPARLFMGDLGSNYLGFLLGALGGLAMLAGAVNFWTLLVLLGIFIVDATSTLAERMSSGAVWYHAHRSHAYQQAALRYRSHGKVVLAAGLINAVWLLPLAWLTTTQERWGLAIMLVAWLPLYLLGRHYRKSPATAG
jgi:Fuc2NAc and GlcNAc transferase